MLQENVEIVRPVIEAVLRGDMEAALAGLDPDVEVDDLDTTLDMDHYRGHDGFLKWLSVWNESWESWRLDSPTAQLLLVLVLAAPSAGASVVGKAR